MKYNLYNFFHKNNAKKYKKYARLLSGIEIFERHASSADKIFYMKILCICIFFILKKWGKNPKDLLLVLLIGKLNDQNSNKTLIHNITN